MNQMELSGPNGQNMTEWEQGGPNKNLWIDQDQGGHMDRIGSWWT